MNTATQPRANLSPEVAEFCRRAVEALRARLPVREVWLFGSHAGGTANRHSDVDLFVVLADDHGLDAPRIECRRALGNLNPPGGCDVTPLPESYWNHPRYRSFGLWRDVAEKGVQLFRSDESSSHFNEEIPIMPGDITLAETWFQFAREDMENARIFLDHGKDDPCFFQFQQATEKLLKGWLVQQGWPLFRTHSLRQLLDEAAARGMDLSWFEPEADWLTEAYIATRYPTESMHARPSPAEAMSKVEQLFHALGVNL